MATFLTTTEAASTLGVSTYVFRKAAEKHGLSPTSDKPCRWMLKDIRALGTQLRKEQRDLEKAGSRRRGRPLKLQGLTPRQHAFLSEEVDVPGCSGQTTVDAFVP